MRPGRSDFALGVAALCLLALAGCSSPKGEEVVVYVALDQDFSKPILDQFARDTGIKVLPKFDVESTKSVGLTQELLAERERPRCDVFWNNEAVNMLRLQDAGLLAAHRSPAGEQFSEEYRARDGTWYGFAARARVLVVNTKLVPAEQRPSSLRDLVDPKWKDRAGIAKPLAGTTATHAACLFAAWGDADAKEYFQQVKANCRVLGGNKQVARAVAEGEIAFGLTDSDDAIVEIEAGMPVAIVFPDQEPLAEGDDALGTLLIPNTAAIIDGAPHRAAAEKLVDFLLSPEVERRLAAGPSAQFPLNQDVKEKSRVAPKEPLKAMKVDFEAAAEKWDAAAKFLRDEFATTE